MSTSLDDELALFEKEVVAVAEHLPISTTDSAPSNGPSVSEPTTGDEPSTSGSAKFVPPQLRTMHPIAQYVRHAPAENSAVIESGPTLYKDAKKANEKAEERSAQPEMKTMALPSDVELLAAKRQSVKAFENSYLSKVLKGEKKMKRFVRTGGGQVWEDPSLADWDPNDFRIFCGDLGNEVSDELLAKAFRKYPSFQKAKVVRDNRTNKSKGYGFVSFKHQDDFIRAMREMDGKYVGNRPIKLRKSNWKDRNQDVVRKKQKMKEKLGLIEKHEVI